MKTVRLSLIVMTLVLVCVATASAVMVSNPVINPTGDLSTGTNVSVSFKIDMTPSGDTTFPRENTLQVYTDLNSAKWKAILTRDGVDYPQPEESGHSIYLTGWVLSYPSTQQESVKVFLEGTVPPVSKSMNKSIVLVQELDSKNTIIPESIVTRERMIVNPTDISQNIAVRESDLRTFRIHIDNMSAQGVNVSAAEMKYSGALAEIQSARFLHYDPAIASLQNASVLIDNGGKLLDRAWAEKEIANAQVPLTQVNELITYFTVNRSMGSEPRLAVIIAKKESAEQYLTTSKDMLTLGNYAFARVKAKDAFAKANESYNDGLKLKKELGGTNSGGNWFTQNMLIIIVGIVIVIIAIAGYIFLRPKNRWEDY
jgi:hypothetical protein